MPDDLACPITFSLMTDPVVCVEDGRVYECAALASALALSLSLSLSPSLSLSLALALALALARCAAIVRFWRFRPLADFYGGPELASAAMRPAHAVRERVARWLDDHDAPTDHGRGGRDSGRSSQLQLDEMACEIEPNPNTLTS